MCAAASAHNNVNKRTMLRSVARSRLSLPAQSPLLTDSGLVNELEIGFEWEVKAKKNRCEGWGKRRRKRRQVYNAGAAQHRGRLPMCCFIRCRLAQPPINRNPVKRQQAKGDKSKTCRCFKWINDVCKRCCDQIPNQPKDQPRRQAAKLRRLQATTH